MKKFYVSVEIKQMHVYEVQANSETEAYEKMDSTFLGDPIKPVDWHTWKSLPGIEYGDCEVYEQSVSDYIREVR